MRYIHCGDCEKEIDEMSEVCKYCNNLTDLGSAMIRVRLNKNIVQSKETVAQRQNLFPGKSIFARSVGYRNGLVFQKFALQRSTVPSA